MSEATKKMPIVALRGMTVLPKMLIHFDIKRKVTVRAINEAMSGDQKVLLLTQIDPDTDKPKKADLYDVGTIGEIKQLIKLPGNVVRVLVEGLEKGYVKDIESYDPFILGKVYSKRDTSLKELRDTEKKAMLSSLKDIIEVYAAENTKLGKDIVKKLLGIKSLENLVWETANKLPLNSDDRQELLEAEDLQSAFTILSFNISQEIEVLRFKKDFQLRVKDSIDKNQKEYILREQMKVIKDELGEDNGSDAKRYYDAIDDLEVDEHLRRSFRREVKKFENMSPNSSENGVVRGYIETLISMPWDDMSVDNRNIKNAIKILNSAHYGLEDVKERIIEFLAVRQLTNKGDAPIICLVGPPGTGKTSIARSVADALKKKYVRISLGGVKDESEIRGHRRTYVGAMPGKIAKGLKTAGVKNPLMLLDEIDKVGSDFKGDVSSALLEVLDSEQNNKFVDHYIEYPIDLSEVLFIATANDASNIPRPLLDRMEIIEVNSYTHNEKKHIARDYLFKKQLEKNGLTKKQLTISPKTMDTIIQGYTKEAGVRSLERKLGAICRKAAREIVEKKVDKVRVNEKNIEQYLGRKKYTTDMRNEQDDVGIVRGLAWTSVGGDTLSIEVVCMPGKGNLKCTGQLGDVMKESAETGLSYIRSIGREYGIEDDYFEKHDIHIHIPEGAVPKDGPSAGITMATAVLSAITNRKIYANLAMTGEVTLRGKVLPIGGLKEKLLAAKQANITKVIVPAKNECDVEELSDEIIGGLDINYVETMKEVLDLALVNEE